MHINIISTFLFHREKSPSLNLLYLLHGPNFQIEDARLANTNTHSIPHLENNFSDESIFSLSSFPFTDVFPRTILSFACSTSLTHYLTKSFVVPIHISPSLFFSRDKEVLSLPTLFVPCFITVPSRNRRASPIVQRLWSSPSPFPNEELIPPLFSNPICFRHLLRRRMCYLPSKRIIYENC